MNIVAVQLDMVWHDKPANHEKVRTLLAETKIEPGSLIILPEMFDCGFSMDLSSTAQTPARESESFLCELAAEHQSAVMGGVIAPVVDGKGANQSVTFAPDGTELVRYHKMQPFALPGEDVSSGFGERHQIFEWQGVKIAPFICYDLRFPEVFRPAAIDGAELIVVIASWPEVRSEHWVRLLQARAIENQAYTVGVNRCGADPQLVHDGRSCGFDPLGVALFEADSSEQVCQIEIDASEVRTWRDKFPALKDIRNL